MDLLVPIEEIVQIEQSMNKIKNQLNKKKKNIKNVVLDCIGESEIKLNDMYKQIGLSYE